MSEQSAKFGGYSWAASNVAQAIADAAEDIFAELVEVAARIERAFPRALNSGAWASRSGPR